nr:unnamed protein product [Spirometra erinaceieuropaei]
MGSPLSSLIAEAVLQRLEALAFDYYRLRLWVRCVDDTSVIINRDKIGKFTQHLNSIFPDIQFTMEEAQKTVMPKYEVGERSVSNTESGLTLEIHVPET